LTGQDLEDADERLALQLSLKLWQIQSGGQAVDGS